MKSKAKKLDIFNTKGKSIGEFELDAVIFDGKISESLLYQAITIYLGNKRKGLASTKTKGEVSGGGRKPWRQKGTGRARVGSSRSPLWEGGGVTFGPRPHSFVKVLPKKMKLMALKSALNAKLRDAEIVLLDDLKIDEVKTKKFAEIIKALKLGENRIKFIVETMTDNIKLSCRNINRVEIDVSKNLNAYGALNCKKLIFTKSAFKEIETRIRKQIAVNSKTETKTKISAVKNTTTTAAEKVTK